MEKWASIGGEHIWNAEGDVWKKVTTTSGTITWRPDQSWKDPNGNGFRVDGTTYKARAVVTAWPLNNTPDYMVVDISDGAKANTQRYYPAVDFLPGSELGQTGAVTNNIAYKTSMLLMRKIMAKGVTWTMGSVAEDGRNSTTEGTHQVTLTNNYYIGVFEVTQTQWHQIAGYYPIGSFTAERETRPMNYASYRDIRQGKGTAEAGANFVEGTYPAAPYGQSYLGLLRTKTQIDFDLPSEAQWEFAARAGHGEGCWGDGSTMRFADDMDANLSRLGRYLNNPSTNSSTAPALTIGVDEGGTAKVGSYCPNAWGLYDMHGNASEWCLDNWANNIKSLNGAVCTYTSENSGIRGGAWKSVAANCRPAARFSGARNARFNTVGFRVACTAGLE